MNALRNELKQPLAELLLSIADDKFILGHRNADWTGLAPILEEDIAFSALAQDDIAHAAALYEFVADLSGDDPNRLAYGRKPHEYRCAAIVELEDDFDWAVALVRHFFCNHFDKLRLQRLSHSAHPPLADLAQKMALEEDLSVGHADGWIVRLAHGTDESRDRIRAALERVTPLTPTLFEPTEGIEQVETADLYPPLNRPMFEVWREMVENVIEQAGLQIAIPKPDANTVGGRRGKHSDAFGPLLDELAEVYRIEPQAHW